MDVFPAPAGMSRLRSPSGPPTCCVPRTCGDEPVMAAMDRAVATCSPTCGDEPNGLATAKRTLECSPHLRG